MPKWPTGRTPSSITRRFSNPIRGMFPRRKTGISSANSSRISKKSRHPRSRTKRTTRIRKTKTRIRTRARATSPRAEAMARVTKRIKRTTRTRTSRRTISKKTRTSRRTIRAKTPSREGRIRTRNGRDNPRRPPRPHPRRARETTPRTARGINKRTTNSRVRAARIRRSSNPLRAPRARGARSRPPHPPPLRTGRVHWKEASRVRKRRASRWKPPKPRRGRMERCPPTRRVPSCVHCRMRRRINSAISRTARWNNRSATGSIPF